MRPPRASLLLPLVLVGCASKAGPPEDEVDRYIAQEMAEEKIPAVSVLVVKDGKVLKQRAYGRPRLDSSAEATPRTAFPIFSITKTFTAVGVLRLVDRGKLALDDPLGKLLPDQPAAWRPITVRQLLSHTSGLPDLFDESRMQYVSEDREAALRAMAARPMIDQPGESFAYIQTGYVLLGKVVERVTGKPFARYMTEEFFAPLGMTSTTYGNLRSEVPGRAKLYQTVNLVPSTVSKSPVKLGRAVPSDDLDNPPYNDVGATLNTNTEDLLKWEEALASGRLLKPETLAAMWKPSPVSIRTGGTRMVGMGLGWYVSNEAGRRSAFHNGGMASLYERWLDGGPTVVVLTNCRGADTSRLAERLRRAYGPEAAR